MQATWLRKQSGQAVVLVAVAVLLLTAILALALDGGSMYLDKRQLQNAADSAALAGAELLMAVPPSYASIHNQAMTNLLQNVPGTSKAGTVCSVSCPSQKTLGLPGGTGIGGSAWLTVFITSSTGPAAPRTGPSWLTTSDNGSRPGEQPTAPAT